MPHFEPESRDRERCRRCALSFSSHLNGRCPGVADDPPRQPALPRPRARRRPPAARAAGENSEQARRHTDPMSGEQLSNRDYFARALAHPVAVCVSGHRHCAAWERGPCAPAIALLIDLEDEDPAPC